MKDFELKPSACPVCGHVLDAAAGVDALDAPRDDDVTLCISCGAILCFTKGGGVRRAQEADINRLDGQQRRLVLAMRGYIEGRGRIG